MSDISDIESTWRAFERQPDVATFEAFHTSTRDLAARIAWRALGDSDWMEDAMQALYARLWQDRATRRIPAGLSAREALIRWTLNECRTLNRRRALVALREAPLEAAAAATGEIGLDEATDHRLVAESLRRILATLPDAYREALLACEIEGATHAEAGNILGIPARTVQTHVRRGKELLARKLRKAGITIPAGAALALYAAEAPAALASAPVGDIIGNASAIVAKAGALAPPEAAAAGGGLLSVPALAVATACVAGAVVLVWALAAPPTSPSGVDETDRAYGRNETNAVTMASGNTATDSAITNTHTTAATTEQPGTASQSATPPSAELANAVLGDSESAEEPSSNAQTLVDPAKATGRVVSAVTRQGISGVEVGLITRDADYGTSTIPLDSPVRTDEHGYFHIPSLVADRYGEQELAALHARGDGFAFRTVLIVPQMFFAGDPPLIEIPMPPGGSISGTLYGPTGAPVADALIGFPFMGEVDVASAMEKGYFITSGSVTKTDSRGEFTLDGLPVGETIDIPIIADDLPRRFENDILVGSRDRSIFIEEAGQTLHGVVTREGSPVEGVRISTNPLLEMHSEPQDMFRSMVFSRSTQSGPDGRYEIRGMVPGEYRGVVSDPSAGLESFEAVIRSGLDANVDIDLPAAKPVLSVTFLAKDHETDQPIPGVRLSVHPFVTEIPGRKPVMREPSNVAMTKHDGLAFLPVDGRMNNSQFYVHPPDGWVQFTPQSGTRLRWNPLRMPAPGSPEVQVLHFTRGEIYRGRVLDVDGKSPDPEAWIQVSGSDYPIDVDGEGRFGMSFAPNDPRQFVIHGRRGGLLVDAQSTAGTDFVLQPYAMISGRVEDTDGSPVHLLSLSVHHLVEPRREIPSPISFAVTSADGRFLLRDIVSGRISIRMNTTADTPSRIANLRLELDLAPEETRRDVIIKPEPGRTFEGIVTNEDAEPLPGVYVYLTPRRDPGDSSHIQSHRGRTDTDGYWRVTDVPERPIESVQFSREGYNNSFTRAEEGQSVESPVNAMLLRQNEVRLRVLDGETGQPIAWYRATQFDPRSYSPHQQDPSVIVSPDADGLSRASSAKEGHYFVRVEELDQKDAPTGRFTHGMFQIGSGGETEILELRIGGGSFPVTGGVGLIPGWHPVEGARVTVGDFSPFTSPTSTTIARHGPEAFTDAEGNFTIHLGPGAWQLVAEKDGHWCVSPQTVTVTDGPAALEHRIAVQVLPSPARN